jgi:hypothetical protein
MFDLLVGTDAVQRRMNDSLSAQKPARKAAARDGAEERRDARRAPVAALRAVYVRGVCAEGARR